MFKLLDIYIIKKYLGTFFLSIVLIISVSIVFDLAEKMDDFISNNAPLKEIVFHYYANFIPFFANLLSPLFAFISVIFFTSKLAYNTEIIAMLSTGMSFKRLLVPYFVAASLIGLMSFVLGGYIIPSSNEVRLEFQDKYIKKIKSEMSINIQLELEPGVIAYIERYEKSQNRGYHFSLESFDGKRLASRLTAQYIIMDSLNHWHITNYRHREFDGMYEKLSEGERLDTIIKMNPEDFFISKYEAPQMTNTELRQYLKRQKERGVGGITAFENEYNMRFSMPFAALILTLIGLSLSSRKVRGGTGLHLGVGLLLSALYILFSTVSSTFAVNGNLPSFIAVWMPNFIFISVGIYLYHKAPK